MADIELVIKIDEKDFKIMKHNIAVNNPLCPLNQEEMVSKVANGMPLPKGKWEVKGQDIYCSICGEQSAYNVWGASKFSNYCPNCGADMRGE